MTKPKSTTRKTLTLTSKAKSPKAKKAVQQTTPEAPAAVVTPESTPAPTATPEPTPAVAPAAQEQPAKTVKAKAAAPKAKPTKPRGKSVTIYELALAHPEKAGQEFADLVIASGVKSSAETIGTIR